ncbi:hypothetical protein SCLARK_001755 [Spiroplasma clarkii]|uniref:Uncharacterized protein n=1 Tax=Spiroplasma clarkii TaxID=2139 RepID=A0A1Y0L3C0_9MOLU|nr:hypothetical protein [Spiroplasma clarkii]ARU92208.1 hypothetical protein SCLARK_001755 [Spiroplasma clarkii]ATX71530.1 hypothetical protein SCLAR_v1c12300 [Spiroplasma clarkii]
MNYNKNVNLLLNAVLFYIIFHYTISFVNYVHTIHALNSYFLYFLHNPLITFAFDAIMFCTLVMTYSKFLQIVDKNSISRNDCKWIFKISNLKIIIKLADLTIPFVIFKVLDSYFLIKYYYGSSLTGVYFPYLAMAVFFVTTLTLMYLVFGSLIHKQLVISYEDEVDWVIFRIYKRYFYLTLLVFDLKHYIQEFDDRINFFIKNTKWLYLIRYQEIQSGKLVETKKSTTPPELNIFA